MWSVGRWASSLRPSLKPYHRPRAGSEHRARRRDTLQGALPQHDSTGSTGTSWYCPATPLAPHGTKQIPRASLKSQADVPATCIDIAGLSRVEGETLWSLTHHAFALVMLKISISKPEAARTSHRHRGDSPCILIHLRCWLR
jgi:hypothetical protein